LRLSGLPLRHAVAAAVLFQLAAPARAEAANACLTAADSGQDLQKAGKLRDARAQFLVCAQKNCNSVVRNDCERWLKEVDDAMPSVIVRVVDARGQDILGARVTIDDAPIALDGKPVSVDPGQRAIKARAKSGDVAESKVLVVEHEKARVVELKFTTELAQDSSRPASTTEQKPTEQKPTDGDANAAKAGSPSLTLPITLAAIGGVALGAFAFFEITGHAGYSDLENGCKNTPQGCSDQEIDPVKSKFVAAGVSLGISVVALGAAAILYFTRKPANASFRTLSPVVRF
jgi:hypothetical protein